MNCLLDTHVVIWSQEQLENIGTTTLAILEDTANDIYISPVSTLEIARLIQLRQISLRGKLKNWIEAAARNLLAHTIEVSHAIAMKAYDLTEPFHKDPADRLLVASAGIHELTMITADEKILNYPHVRTHNARA
jgi:PIN domain nuclease of toxin-antitoxin system